MSADFIMTGETIRIADIGCGLTRRMLCSMEPGSRVWLRVAERDFLFERNIEAGAGGAQDMLLASDASRPAWLEFLATFEHGMPEFDFEGRPGVPLPERYAA